MAGTYTEVNQEFIQLFLYSENNMNSQIINLTNEIKGQLDYKRKLEADVNIIKNSNDKLVERINRNERHC